MGIFEAFNGTSTHHAGYITSVIDSLWIALFENNPDKWTWLWGEFENVDGTAYNDVISGNDLNNKLNGGSGDDSIVGGEGDDIFDFSPSQRQGDDTLTGGLGNDVYVIDSLLDIVVEEAGEGVDQIYVPFNYSLKGTYIENIAAIGGLFYGLALTGSTFGNVIKGELNSDSVYGLEGDDTIYGYGGDDILNAGAGLDKLYGGAGDDKIYSRSPDMGIDFNDGGNLLSGEDGNDSIYGGSGSDSLYGGDGGDFISAGNGLDTVYGGDGDDKIYSRYSGMAVDSDDGSNLILGEGGNDTAYGGNGNDSIYGGLGNDSLMSMNGDDSIAGNDGDDYLSGSSGNDTLNAGNGLDTVYGGDGDDVIYSRYSSMESGLDDGENYLNGGKGNDKIFGGNGGDTIIGGGGNDSIYGSNGSDLLIYGASLDNYSISWIALEEYFLISSNIDGIDRVSGVEEFAFNNLTVLSESLKDTISPAVISIIPADQFSAIDISSNIIFTFSESIRRGANNIIIKTSYGAIVATYAQASTEITISGSMLTIKPAAGLIPSTGYKVEFVPGSVQDLDGNNYAGANFYNFTTNSPPTATSVSITTNEDQAKTGTMEGTDLEGSSLTFAKVADPTNGTVTINANTGAYTYTPKANYNGSDSFTFKVNDGTADSAIATVSISANAINDVPNGIVTITGTVTQGQALTAINNMADVDGIPTTGSGAISYQWKAGGVNIAGAISSTYTLTQAQVGKAITVTASYTDQQGTDENMTSSATAAVTNVNDAATGTVSITGTASQGQTLTAVNTLADLDGTPASGASAIVYQWLADGANIAGATGSTLVLTQAQVSKAISVKASFTDLGGTAESMTSSATAAVTNVNDAATGTVSITGTASQGQTLTASQTLADLDGIPTSGDGAIKYQWKAGDAAINGATASTYILTQAEVGKSITVTAGYTDLFGQAESVSSAGTSAVLGINPVITPAKFWKDANKTPSETNKAGAVNLTDAISILKMIVGLSVNANAAPLSPHQAVAADFDQSGSIDLTDAIGVLKMVVGLNAPAPTWKYFDDAKLANAYNATQSLNHKAWSAGAAMDASSTADSTVKLVGVLTGDVDGSWAS